VSDIDRLSVWAARYAIGRRTYAVRDVCDVLTRRVSELSGTSRAAILRAIDEAEAEGEDALGMAMDAREWRRLREVLRDG